MERKKMIYTLLILTTMLALLLAACGGKNNAGEETEDENTAITQVVETAMVALTQTAAANPATPTYTATVAPSSTPLPTMQPSPTQGLTTPTATLAIQQPPGGNSGSTSTCDNAEFVSDVTIPDGTELARGEEFTKTWEIKNIGTCTWSAAYQIVFYGGEQMGVGATAALTGKEVAPGETIKVSLDMTAPDADGEYYSYWILRNANGQNFFIGGSSIYVQIKVGSAPTKTPAATGAASATPTATSAPNDKPTVTISVPTAGETFTKGTAVTFTATANDTEDGDLAASIVWTYTDSSSNSGSMAGGGNISHTFNTADTYTITATVTDSGGKKATATVSITITD